MAALCHLPNFTSPLSSRKFSLSSPLQLPNFQIRCCSRISASSFKKPRSGRKAKRNAELCNEIRKFLSSVGLPENHVPSVKDLSQNGRQDLANIIRRRGYKYIRQLLDESNTASLNDSCMGTDQTLKLEELSVSEGQNENLEVLSGDVLSREGIQEDNGIVTDECLKLNNQSSLTSESATLSLQEKVAKFIEHGELDTIEGCGLADEAEWNSESENADKHDLQQKDVSLSFSSSDETFYENASPSLPKNEHAVFEHSSSRNIHFSPEEQTSNDKNLDSEAWKLENDAEIKRLKFLLHQKEMELTQLKQQIKKEKLSLSVSQTEAEKKMSLVQKLISEKETQLQVAEESLSGLKEVEIVYSGDGETVELAGSFNGWHNTIRMDLQTTTETRTSRVWRVVLWLYPGVYEIKFIVDGQWKIDPQRESTAPHSLQNNILRVDR